MNYTFIKNTMHLFLLIFFSSCMFKIKNTTQGEHPELIDDKKIVFVKTSYAGNAEHCYYIDNKNVPVWCNINQKDVEEFLNFKALFFEDSFVLNTEFLVLCYTGTKPQSLNFDNILKTTDTLDVSTLKNNDDIFIISQKNNNIKGTLIAFKLKSKLQEAYMHYFYLYRKNCNNMDDVNCCMSANFKEAVLFVFFKNITELAKIQKNIKQLIYQIRDKQFTQKDIAANFNMFKSFLSDDCEFNKWYYQLLQMGIKKPDMFLEFDNWINKSKTKLEIKQIGLKIYDNKETTDKNIYILKKNISDLF